MFTTFHDYNDKHDELGRFASKGNERQEYCERMLEKVKHFKEDYMKIQTQGANFIIEFNGMPFQVTKDYPKAEQYGEEYTYAYIKEYAKNHPDEVSEYVEPQPSEEDKARMQEQQKQLRIATLQNEAQQCMAMITAGIDTDHNKTLMTQKLLEIEELKGNLE